MRLIDADKLYDELKEVLKLKGTTDKGRERARYIAEFIDFLGDASTIEAIPIEWRLFPETTPKGFASYLVTYLDKNNKKQVTVGWLVGNRWYYKHNNVMERIEGVIAFAQLPEPYIVE